MTAFTLRKNGKYMATIHIAVNINEELVKVVADRLNVRVPRALALIKREYERGTWEVAAWRRLAIDTQGDLVSVHLDDVDSYRSEGYTVFDVS